MRCQFYTTPPPDEAASLHLDADAVFGCMKEQGDGPLWFFVPVQGGAVRAAVCAEHGDLLDRIYNPPGEATR